MISFTCRLILLLVTLSALLIPVLTQNPPDMYSALRWRMIGPHRGGRVLAVSGVPGQADTFYFGSVCGGIWKTTDAGRTWKPLFDDQPVASIGDLAVANSDPNVIYAGTGEADMRSDISFGNGVYKSTDAGKTWTHLGLRDTRQIGRIIVDPRDPSVVLVAALGHGFGPNAERGVFRSTDGGGTWKKVLYKDENTGAIDLSFDPDNSQTVYATLWNARRVAWSQYAPVSGPGGGLFKSTDGGVTWKQVQGNGLPEGQWGRSGVAVGQHGRRVYLLIDADRPGLYRSDDAGETWRLVGTDERIRSRAWYFSGVTVDPHNPDVVYVSNVSLYRSSDGGQTFSAIRGAPGGDDYHTLWIDPNDSRRMISGVDQGAIITVNGGQTWSTWFNQPTAQFYHVAVDHQFPYQVYGAQQDSGTAAIKSRSDYGAITFRDWQPIGAGESGYILPDPVDPDVVYGGNTSGETYRFNRSTGQVQDVTPTPPSPGGTTYRYPWTTAIAFGAQPPHALYQGAQFVFKTTNGGAIWTTISPDLTVRKGAADEGKAVIWTIATSPLIAGQLWVGTDNSLIQLTRDDGKTWHEVSPKGLPEWSMISLIDASPFDAGTAYAAVDRHQVDDVKPYIYRTHDFGKTWARITDGIPEPAFVHAVRADPVRKGLLFAGTEFGVYVSFDDGGHWQSLQLNLPVVSVRDLMVKNNDLVIATHGRSFWVLDDITPLRQINEAVIAANVHLFQPAAAIRLRQNENRDTPLQPEMAVGSNPPAGAIIDYRLKSEPAGEVTLEILDSAGKLVRRYSSADETRRVEDVETFPTYWLRPPAPLSKRAGMNRFVWDLRHTRPPALKYNYGMAVVYGDDTPLEPRGAMALPGRYQVKLTVDGRSYSAPLEIRMDPRVNVALTALNEQLILANRIEQAMAQSHDAARQVQDLRRQLRDLQSRLQNQANGTGIADAAKAIDQKLALIEGGGARRSGDGLVGVNSGLGVLMTMVTSADAAPTAQMAASYREFSKALDQQLATWREIRNRDLLTLNAGLRQRQLPAITVTTGGAK